MSIENNLATMEESREAYWLKYPSTAPIKLRWRAVTVRHCFHVLPGETLLELGAGSGLWTAHLLEVLSGRNAIVGAVFNSDLVEKANQKELINAKFVLIHDLLQDLPEEAFDYVVGNSILCHNLYPQNLYVIYRLLKPGGQILFFEANYWNPQVFAKNSIRLLRKASGQAPCQIGMRKIQLMQMASHQGFTHLDIIPYDIIHPRTPRSLISYVQSKAYVFEQAPLIRELCGTLYIWAKKPGDENARRPKIKLTEHKELSGAVSFVIPAFNEEMNIPRLVDAIVQFYDEYIHEIIIVNDNSRDGTEAVTRELAKREPRVKLVNRTPPNGVGLALRDGYAAATGRYILTMDCDFVQILPEMRDLFDAVANGRDGAIGSRFSHDSILINYPFIKILCNRSFHILVKLLLLPKVRDVSNNLKLYRAEILKDLVIEEPHFAGNLETGLKPLLAGYDIEEIPVSWINRTVEMGRSSFRIVKVAPNYFSSLVRIIWRSWRAEKVGSSRSSAIFRRESTGTGHDAESKFLSNLRK
jgi:glycosyltransferase involved in cell wall biosynthesis/ubiquinone/menaquinone biosynthesis C-methylase UbiE